MYRTANLHFLSRQPLWLYCINRTNQWDQDSTQCRRKACKAPDLHFTFVSQSNFTAGLRLQEHVQTGSLGMPIFYIKLKHNYACNRKSLGFI